MEISRTLQISDLGGRDQTTRPDVGEGTFGYHKVLTRRGRVVYKIDQDLVGLGFQGPDAYLRDENGNPVPETVRKVDTKAMRFILEWYRRDTWGKHPKRNAACVRIIFGLLSHVTDDKYATLVKVRKWKSGWRWIWEEKD